MPELPEVETVRRGLESLIIGKTIISVEVRCPKLIKNVDVSEFESVLVNQTFRKIRRFGKYLYLDLDDYTIVSHLRMEGKYNYYDEYTHPTKHDHVIFNFSDESILMYNDTRQFGTLELVKKEDEASLKGIAKLGYEPFDQEMTSDYLYNKAKRRTITIKQFLLDQSIIVGLGNIYVDEVLFSVKIHPETKVNKLKKNDFELIIEASKNVLTKAIKLGGTTIHSFLSVGNLSGKFQNQLQVYGRAKQPCVVCQTPIEKIKVGGRGTHFCPKCQKKL